MKSIMISKYSMKKALFTCWLLCLGGLLPAQTVIDEIIASVAG